MSKKANNKQNQTDKIRHQATFSREISEWIENQAQSLGISSTMFITVKICELRLNQIRNIHE